MEERNFNRRYAKEYNIWMNIFYKLFLYCVVYPVAYLQYTMKIEGKENLEKNKRYIFTGNHTSFLDPPFLGLCTNQKIAFMAKKELFEDKKGILRFLVKNLGAFAVNRENPEMATFKTVIDILKTDWTLGIFPEGKTNDTKILKDIHKGFIKIAQKAKADIVPVAIKGFDGYAGKTLFKKHMSMKICKPISYKLDEDEILHQWADAICEYTGYKNEVE